MCVTVLKWLLGRKSQNTLQTTFNCDSNVRLAARILVGEFFILYSKVQVIGMQGFELHQCRDVAVKEVADVALIDPFGALG